MPDACDTAFENGAIAVAVLSVERAEPKRIHRSYWPRSHRKNIAKNAADARGGPLERFDEARVIMRFDLERHAPVVANVHHTAIFAGAYDDPFARCWRA